MIVFSQVPLENDQHYNWTISLCHGNYSLIMRDSYGDGWSSGSYLKIKRGHQVIGTFTCAKEYTFASFSIAEVPTQPPCISEEVTFIRKTMAFGAEESFSIIDNRNTAIYSQPEVSDYENHVWTASLCHGDYTLRMEDSYGDGWSTDSSVTIKIGSSVIGTFSCTLNLTEASFTVSSPKKCPALNSLPEAVVGTSLSTSCSSNQIGYRLFSCQLKNNLAIWTEIENACFSNTPPKDHSFIVFTIRIPIIPEEKLSEAIEKMKASFASALHVSVESIQIVHNPIVFSSRRLEDGIDIEIQILETTSKSASLVNSIPSSLPAIESSLKREYPSIFTDSFTITMVDHPIVTSAPQSYDDYECNQKGYLQYLSKWSVEEKSTSRNPSTPEFKERLDYFIDSCMKIQDWNSRDKYKMEFTYYADWSVDEFEAITSTTQRYSGVRPEIPVVQPSYNNSSYRSLLPSLDPCDDVIEGGNDLRSVISKPQSCSVSWAFAVTSSIEYAVKKMYKDEFDQIVNVALSAQELIDCVGKEHGLENGCEGMPTMWGFEYIYENGIAFRQYYPHTNVEGECKEIEDEHKYHIAGYEKPFAYNKYGLFELMKKGPVAVTLGLDSEYFQYYQSDRASGPYFDTAFWKPSVYGVVVEYSQYESEDSDLMVEWPFFAIESRLRACDSMIFRVPIRDSLDDANIAGITGFAIRPIVSELLPN